MARLILKLGKGMTGQKDIADALHRRASPRLVHLKITNAHVARGDGTLEISGERFEEWYILTFEGPESCPVRDYVAYRQPDGIHTAARAKSGYTREDLELMDNSSTHEAA